MAKLASNMADKIFKHIKIGQIPRPSAMISVKTFQTFQFQFSPKKAIKFRNQKSRPAINDISRVMHLDNYYLSILSSFRRVTLTAQSLVQFRGKKKNDLQTEEKIEW